jgi:predicted phage replisome organizer
MADVKWIKIVTDVFDDEKILLIETLPEADSIIVLWFKLLCLAGKQNNSGVFMLNDKMPYNEKMFATIFRRKEATVQLAFKTFEDFGMIEIINGAVTIPNWGKHQTLDRIEQKNEYMRNYMRDYRDKQKQLIYCKTNSKANSKVNVSEAEEEREEEVDKNKNKSNICAHFETFYSLYPRKVNKKKAQDKYLSILKKAKNPDEKAGEILTGLKRYVAFWEKSKTEKQFIPHPVTWLNQERWTDEVEIPTPQNKASGNNEKRSMYTDL